MRPRPTYMILRNPGAGLDPTVHSPGPWATYHICEQQHSHPKDLFVDCQFHLRYTVNAPLPLLCNIILSKDSSLAIDILYLELAYSDTR